MKDLSYGNEGRLIFRFAVPMLLGNVFQQMYNVVDSVIVGKFIGKEALAAVGTSFPIIFMMISLIIGITMGFTIVVSQYFGAKDMDKVRRTINTLYIFLVVASLVMTLIGILTSVYIFRLINLPESIIPDATLFLNIYFAGMVFVFGYNGTSAILRGLGDSKTPLYFLIGSVVVNIILDFVLVLGFHLGVAGVAWATVISQALAFFSQIIYLNRYHDVVRFSFRDLRFDPAIFSKSIKIGLPTGFQQTFVALGGIALYGIVNKFGVDANAAYSAAGRIDTFALLPAMSFSIALSTFVGQNLGANKPERVRKGFVATLLMTAAFSAVISIITVTMGSYIMMLFTSDPAVIHTGRNYLLIVGAFYVVFSTMFVIGSVMRGAGDTLIPMFITLFALWVVRIPSAFLMSKAEYLGINGIWWSIPFGWGIGVALSYLYYRTGVWKKKAVVKYDAGGTRIQ